MNDAERRAQLEPLGMLGTLCHEEVYRESRGSAFLSFCHPLVHKVNISAEKTLETEPLGVLVAIETGF